MSADLATCFKCAVVVKRKKANNCSDCGESFCKDHIKASESEFSSICIQCLKKRVHLEISMEMETQILHFKSELRNVRANLKNSKKNLEETEESIEEMTAKQKKSKKKHAKQVKKMQDEIEKITGQVDWNEFKEKVKEVEGKRDQISDLENKKDEVVEKVRQGNEDILGLKEDIKGYSEQLNDLTYKSKYCVTYTVIRAVCCDPCKNLIKKQFADEIVKGYAGHNSVIASIVHKDSEKSIRYSLDGKTKKSDPDSCNCLIS